MSNIRYGGTKTEMQRLLKDAKAISGTTYDINKLSDVYEAIHVIQTELGVTGTTAKEASSTLSGSMNSMKASFKDFLGNLAIGSDIQKPLSNLVQSTSTFLFKNLIPSVLNIFKALPQAIGGLFKELAPLLSDEMIGGFLGDFRKKVEELAPLGADMLEKIGKGIGDNIPVFVAKIPMIVTSLVETIGANAPTIIMGGYNMIKNILIGVGNAVPILINAIPPILKSIYTSFINYDWYTLGRNMIEGIARGVGNAVQILIEAVKNVAGKALGAIRKLLGIHSPSKVFADQVGQWIPKGIAEGVLNNSGVVSSAMESIASDMTNTSQRAIDSVSWTRGGNRPSVFQQFEKIADRLDNMEVIVYNNTSLSLDGREIARASSPYTQKELEKNQALKNRLVGVKA